MGVDIGNIWNRKNSYSYYSTPYNAGNSKPVSIHWNAETPLRTSIKFQLRASGTEKELAKAEWRGPDGPESYYTENNEPIRKVSGQWVQYRAVFDMNNGADTPILKSVDITFDK
jgi:hypothetical protein